MSKLKVVDLFPKAIGVAQLESLTAGLMEQAIELIEIGNNVSKANQARSSYTQEQQILEGEIFRDVKAEILVLCREFSKAHSHVVEDIGICNSWGNTVSQWQNIHYHRHSNSYISGSFYLTYGSPFNILNVDHPVQFGFLPEIEKGADNYRSFSSFNIEPKPGRLVLFPSSLQHCVMTSESPEKRYSIAFNTVPLGKFGEPTGRMNLRMG